MVPFMTTLQITGDQRVTWVLIPALGEFGPPQPTDSLVRIQLDMWPLMPQLQVTDGKDRLNNRSRAEIPLTTSY